jgi:hypothetical protein
MPRIGVLHGGISPTIIGRAGPSVKPAVPAGAQRVDAI